MEVNGRLHASDVLHPGEEPPVLGCVGPRDSLDVVEERKVSSSSWELDYDSYVV
jgi:hypothetical protein